MGSVTVVFGELGTEGFGLAVVLGLERRRGGEGLGFQMPCRSEGQLKGISRENQGPLLYGFSS